MKLRLLCFLAACFLGAIRSSAQADDADKLLNAWIDAQAKVKTWTADLTQTRTMKSFAQPLISQGHVWFVAPNRFRWELGNPPQTIAIRQPEQLLVIYPKLKRAEKYPFAEAASGQWKDALALLETGFPRDRKDLESRFNIKGINPSGETAEVVLEPKSAGAKRMIPQFKIVFGTKDFSLRATEMQFADGSTMRNDFRNPKIDEPVSNEVFSPEISKDFKVIEPLASKKVPLKK